MNHGPENTPSTEPGQGPDALSPVAPPDGAADGGAVGAPGTDGGTLTELFGDGTRPDGGVGTGAGTASDSEAEPAEASATDLAEDALRRMLHGAVEELQPAEGALVRLHRAVPARRARRRQAVIGVAAAALLIGTAVPAFVHVASSDGSSTANAAIAGHGEQAQGGNGAEAGAETGGEQPAGPADEQNQGSQGTPENTTAPSEKGSDTQGTGTGAGADRPSSETAAMPACDPGQLGVAAAQSGAAGADGTVYGSFRIANVSDKGCSVSSSGSVGFQVAGAADKNKIEVVQHIAGDAAAGLPDPSLEPGTVLLKPTMAYEVKFAWVPTDTCPTTGTSPSPTPTDAVGGGSTGSGTEADGTAPQFAGADEGPAEGSIAVTHTPEAGAPTAETNIPNACAGTIYRTGVLDAS